MDRAALAREERSLRRLAYLIAPRDMEIEVSLSRGFSKGASMQKYILMVNDSRYVKMLDPSSGNIKSLVSWARKKIEAYILGGTNG